MKPAGLSIAAALVLLSAGVAAEPVKLGQLGDGSTLYLAARDGSGSQRLVRTLRVFPEPRKIGEVSGVVAEIDWQRADCAARTFEAERLEWYGNAQAQGKPLQEFDIPPSLRQVVSVQADDRSAVGVIWNAVCLDAVRMAVRPAAPAQPQPAVPQPPVGRPQPVPAPVRPLPAEPPERFGDNGAMPYPPAPRGPDNGRWPPEQDVPAIRPEPPRQPEGGTLASQRPFPESVFTLGTMGRLAQYIYYDQEQAALLAAVSDTIARAQPRMVPGTVMKGLVDVAGVRNDKERSRYQAALAEKDAMLAREALVSEPLPQLPAKPISAFRAELYRHVPSGELILVFRGSQEGLDWLSNAWLGFDLLSIEAPHYQAARDLTERIVRSGRKPIVVGHSLGGGMAQYVGQMFDLKVVAFNSSPLPARYIPAKYPKAPKNLRLFSAIEFYDQPNNTTARADPVSLGLPKLAEAIAIWRGVTPEDSLIKAHQHLVLPVCVASRPHPFRNEEEDEKLARLINNALYPSAIGYMLSGSPMKGAMEQGMQVWIGKEVGRQLSDPAWQPASRNPFDKRVSEHAKKLVATAAIDAFHAAQGAAKMGSVLYNTAFGSIWKAAGTMGKSFAVTMGKVEIGLLFMPHSMERFNRGMQAEVGADVFLARTVNAQCQPPASTY